MLFNELFEISGAVAVTKLPVLAAGIALGPIVSSSICYAKNAFNARQKAGATTENNETPKEVENNVP